MFEGLFSSFKKVAPNLHALYVAIAVIILWRGIWGLIDVYVFPDNRPLSYFLSALSGLVLLYIDDGRFKEIGGVRNE